MITTCCDLPKQLTAHSNLLSDRLLPTSLLSTTTVVANIPGLTHVNSRFGNICKCLFLWNSPFLLSYAITAAASQPASSKVTHHYPSITIRTRSDGTPSVLGQSLSIMIMSQTQSRAKKEAVYLGQLILMAMGT